MSAKQVVADGFARIHHHSQLGGALVGTISAQARGERAEGIDPLFVRVRYEPDL